jgi:hypothetical protein
MIWGAGLPAGITNMRDFFTRRAATSFEIIGAYTFGYIIAHSHGWSILAAIVGYYAFIKLALFFIEVYYAD